MNKATDIRYLKGVGEKKAESLCRLGIDTIGALLRFYPRAYEDWSNIRHISDCVIGEKVCIRARVVTEPEERKIRSKMIIYKFIIEDSEHARMGVTVFNSKYLVSRLHNGSEYLFYGKFGGTPFLPEFSSPEIAEAEAAGIRPIYRANGSVSSKQISQLVRNALFCDLGNDPLPNDIRARNGLCELEYAVKNIHFPGSTEALEAARKRLAFEELFMLQTALFIIKKKQLELTAIQLKKDYTAEFISKLPFEITNAQRRVIAECTADMKSGKRMSRLIQGDVGSGKTAVAAALCYNIAKNGFQSAFMVPTEILAEQHYKTLTAFFRGSGIECVILTGSMKKREKNAAIDRLANGTAAIAVGTHALLTDEVTFARLGLVICDEQHRFGVEQRAGLIAKGAHPHLCVMSATPIPRTLGLIIYGELDISVIDEYPRGRQKIACYLVDGSYRKRVYKYIKKFLDSGKQGYIVCPLVEETENGELTGAEEYYEDICSGEFADYRVGLIHGKMSARRKDEAMRLFASGSTQLLVCTTVIEVGVDVPNASVMLIENAERFGLSQLHQLRGRIGRGGGSASCIMISDIKSGPTVERLEVIKNNNDGFKIADEDLRLRGPGNFLGNRQHGLPALKIADLSSDIDIMRMAGNESKQLLQSDPSLKNPENAGIRSGVKELYRRMRENG